MVRFLPLASTAHGRGLESHSAGACRFDCWATRVQASRVLAQLLAAGGAQFLKAAVMAYRQAVISASLSPSELVTAAFARAAGRTGGACRTSRSSVCWATAPAAKHCINCVCNVLSLLWRQAVLGPWMELHGVQLGLATSEPSQAVTCMRTGLRQGGMSKWASSEADLGECLPPDGQKSGGAEGLKAATRTGQLSLQEARKILGVEPGCTVVELEKARLHPEQPQPVLWHHGQLQRCVQISQTPPKCTSPHLAAAGGLGCERLSARGFSATGGATM